MRAQVKKVIGLSNLLLASLLWGCGQGEENVQVEEEVISVDSVAFADATMKEIISEACKGEADEEPLNPLPLLSDYGLDKSFQGFTMRDGKVFAKYCRDIQDTPLTDMEIYEYRDDEWQYVLYTSDQKSCFWVYDFVNDSFAVYTWRYAADEKGEYVKWRGNTLSDVFIYFDRIFFDEDVLTVYEDVLGYKMPEYAYQIEIDGIPRFLHLSKVEETVYEFYTDGYDCSKREFVGTDFFRVDSLTGEVEAYLDIL